jgi:hypothetical protein
MHLSTIRLTGGGSVGAHDWWGFGTLQSYWPHQSLEMCYAGTLKGDNYLQACFSAILAIKLELLNLAFCTQIRNGPSMVCDEQYKYFNVVAT